MDCEHAIALISAQIDNEIRPGDRELLDRHLTDCPECRATAEAFALQHGDMRHAFEPRRAAAAVVAQQVNAQLPAAARAKPARPSWLRHTAVRVALVAGGVAASVALLLAWLYKPQESRPTPTYLQSLHDFKHSGVQSREWLIPRARPADPEVAELKNGAAVETKAGERRRVALPDGSLLYVNQDTLVRLDGARAVKLERGEVYVEVAQRGPDDPFVVKTPGRDVKALGTKFEVRADDKDTRVVVTQGKVKVSGVADTLHAGQALTAKGVGPAPRASHLLDWTRDLMAAAESPLVPASAYAGGSLIAVDANGQEAKLSLRRFAVDVHIEDGFARTTIDQTYFNHHPWRLEGTFYFPLPPDASLSRLAMYVSNGSDSNLMEGGMAERGHARAVYNQIVNNQRDPALLEWVDGTTFKMRVFPLEGRQEKRILLSYTQRLSDLYGRVQYRFPAGHSLKTVREWDFKAVVKNGAALTATSPTHPLLKVEKRGADLVLHDHAEDARIDKDVAVDLTAAAGTVGLDPINRVTTNGTRFVRAELDGNSYLALRYRPDLPGKTERQRRDWVFVYESSADRDPLLARTQIDIIRHLLANAEHDDTFAILVAGTRTRAFRGGPVPATTENVAAAVAFLEQSHLIGALDLGRAFGEAGPLLKAGKNPYLVHIGSGMTTIGTPERALAKLLPAGVRYVGIGVGKRWNRPWMKAQAERTGGFFTQINPDETIAWRAFDLLATLNTPRLLDVHVVARDSVAESPATESRATFLTDAATLAQGEELFAVARLVPGEKVPDEVTVTGTLDGKAFRAVLPVKDVTSGAGYLPRTWAKWELDRMLLVFQHTGRVETKDEIVTLSKAMYVMTPFTSLLVLENDAMYDEFKVDRGRKDHWALYATPKKIPTVYEPLPNEVDVRNAPQGLKPTPNQVRPTVLVRGGPSFVRANSSGYRTVGSPADIIESDVLQIDSVGGDREGRRVDRLGRAQRLGDLEDASVGNLFGSISSLTTSVDQPADFFALGGQLGQPPINRPMGRVEERAPDRLSDGGLFIAGEYLMYRKSRALDEVPVMPRLYSGRGVSQVRARIMDEGGGVSGKLGKARLDSLSEFGFQTPPQFDGYLGLSLGVGRTYIPPETTLAGGLQRDQLELSRQSGSLSFGMGVNSNDGLTGSIVLSPDGRRFASANEFGVDSLFLDGLVMPDRAAPTLTYQPLSFTADARLFNDLVSYAPGLNTSRADMLAVLDDEAAPDLRDTPGTIDAEARKLIDRARSHGWQTLALSAGDGKPGIMLTFDGSGRYTYERRVSFGLHERVVCDGKTLLHVYPEIGLAARRTLTRFHRAGLADLVPWWLPPATDMARGCDLVLVGPRTVALVPHGVKELRDEASLPRERGEQASSPCSRGRLANYLQYQLVFADDGRLVERQLVLMPEKKVLVRETYDGKGGVRILDADGKEVVSHKRELKEGAAPDLAPDTKDLVVLPLPYRSRAHTFPAAALEPSQPLTSDVNGCYPYLEGDSVLALLATFLAEQRGDEARALVRAHFFDKGNLRPGLFVILAAAGADLTGDPALATVVGRKPDSPLVRYLALGADRTYAFLLHRGPVHLAGSVAPPDTFLGRLAVARELTARWQAPRARWVGPLQHRSDVARTLTFVHDNRDSVLGWAMLVQMQQRGGHEGRDYIAMARAWGELAGKGKNFRARYEQACCLYSGGERVASRRLFAELYAQVLDSGGLPAVDGRFTNALLGKAGADDQWTPLVRATAARFIKDKRRAAVVYLAWQCQVLGDPALADTVLATALDGITNDNERLVVHLAAIDFLSHTGRTDRAGDLMSGLLQNDKWAAAPELWRLASRLASQRNQGESAAGYLERALDLEYRDLPEIIDLQSWRRDYSTVLGHYRELAARTTSTESPLAEDFRGPLAARTIRAADRWRAHDPEASGACRTASEILGLLGENELAWEYLTTPAAMQPEQSSSVSNDAATLSREGKYTLAEYAYEVAAAANPDDPDIVWERAQNLRRAGKRAESDRWLKTLLAPKADESWAWRRARERAEWELRR